MTKKILAGIGIGILGALMFLLLVYGFMYVWNRTIPEVFGFKSIDYYQALGLLIISRVLFGGFGFRWTNSSEKSKFWRERLKMKMQNMSEEEKAEFKRRLWQKCKD